MDVSDESLHAWDGISAVGFGGQVMFVLGVAAVSLEIGRIGTAWYL